jgi:hypothetical protein
LEHHRHVSGARQRLAGVAADKSGTAGDENRLHFLSPKPIIRPAQIGT